ncbi:MAG: hypothetical protein AAGG72_08325, partial [Pseudomonadota bacterium]
TLLISAILLFSVQPVFAKMVLPKLGGSPSVWAVAMCFFQAALLAGYCYAHALNRFAPWQYAPVIHLSVCLIALMALPFGLPAWADEPPTGNTYMWMVAVMTVGVGLPFFAASANAPLLQAWFTKSGHEHANDPYFLYGASNLGSLASLLAYPFLIEPLIGLEAQRTVWAWGFVLLLPLLGFCGVLMLAGLRNRDDDSAATAATKQALSAAPTMYRRATWIGLSFVPSALMVAFTTHVTTDVASAPFLWVIPLATFLGTFILVFRDVPTIPHDLVLKVHAPLAVFALIITLVPSLGGLLIAAGVGFVTFFVTTLVCHRALYEVRPEADRLTEFYMFMSLGGVLGGLFASIIAPQIFNIVLEYPLLIAAGLLARPGMVAAWRDSENRNLTLGVCAILALFAVIIFAAAALEITEPGTSRAALVVLMTIAGIIVAWPDAGAPRAAGAIVGSALIVCVGASVVADGINQRSFFGVSRVTETSDGAYRLYVHGTTVHGGQRLKDEDGNKIDRPPPIAYYYPGSPMARAFDLARVSLEGDEKLRTGVIGLGTGSLACHAKPDEVIRFYEIDLLVDQIARNPEHFTYLSACAPDSETVIGDARITLASSDDTYDLFFIDAFSSDSIPMHLMTREALQLYLRKIPDDGLIVFHISNRHLELESVVGATAASIPGVHAAAVFDQKGLPGLLGNPTHVVYLAKSKDVIDRVMATTDARAPKLLQTTPWTDDYADIFSALWRKKTAGE